MDGRKVLLVIILLMLTIIGLSFRFYGYESTWQLWNIPTLMPSFIDLRMLPGSADSYRAGFNPVYQNPGDPLQRPFNLPFAWTFVFYIGLEQQDTVWLGASLALGYLFCSWIFPGRLGVQAACLMALILFSPASMLAIERGNVDLFVFILCTLVLLLHEDRTWLAAAILMMASFLKLFPVFGLTVFMNKDRSRFLLISSSSAAIFLVYAVLTYSSISASFAYTEQGAELAYGANVIALYMGQQFQSDKLFELLTMLLSFSGLGLCIYAFHWGSKTEPLYTREWRHLSAFRLGAMIYVGTFLIGNNWDYRLIFLLFTIPQLVEWSRESQAQKSAQWTLAALVIACWYLIQLELFSLLSTGKYVAYFLDQISKWGLFAGLCYLFLASAPEWLRAEFKRPFALRKSQPD